MPDLNKVREIIFRLRVLGVPKDVELAGTSVTLQKLEDWVKKEEVK